MSRLRIGVAIGERGVTLVARVRDVTHRADEPLGAGAHEDTGALSVALRAAAEKLAVLTGVSLDGARVHVALPPPLADVRLVQLPPLRRGEAEAVLRRDAARHFVGGAGARVIAVANTVTPKRSDDGEPGTFAAAASLSVVEAARSAVAAAGWRLEAIVPAQAAWLAALPTARRSAESADVLIALHDDAAHIIRRESGAVTVVRRVPQAWRDEVVAAAGAAPGTAVLLADGAVRDPFARALRAAGWTVTDTDPSDAAGAAAALAGSSRLSLVSPLQAAAARDRQRSIGVWVAAAAVVLLAGAAALELWGTRRELEVVRARRAELQDDVSPLLATRDSLTRLEAHTATIRGLADASPRWTRAVFDMALLLPPDARLTRFTTSGDTLYIEAAGARAGAALQSLRDAGSIEDVRMDGAVLRDLEAGETVVERFRVRAVLSKDPAWSPSATRSVGDEAGQPPVSRGDGENDRRTAGVRRSM